MLTNAATARGAAAKALHWICAALIIVHIGGAFYHSWHRKDDVMQRMLPEMFARQQKS